MKRVLVLVVEDEDFLVAALRDNLLAEGCTVDVAIDGEDAMVHIAKTRPNLILLDLLMPKKDGFYVLEAVRKDPELRTIPIVVLSNLGGDAEIKRALEMGASDYLVKSQHSIDEVLEKIKKFLNGTHKLNSSKK